MSSIDYKRSEWSLWCFLAILEEEWLVKAFRQDKAIAIVIDQYIKID